jgi:hypothetical protein
MMSTRSRHAAPARGATATWSLPTAQRCAQRTPRGSWIRDSDVSEAPRPIHPSSPQAVSHPCSLRAACCVHALMSRVHAPLLHFVVEKCRLYDKMLFSTTKCRQVSQSSLCTLGSRLAASPPCSLCALCCVHAPLPRVRACAAAPRAPSRASCHRPCAHVSSVRCQACRVRMDFPIHLPYLPLLHYRHDPPMPSPPPHPELRTQSRSSAWAQVITPDERCRARVLQRDNEPSSGRIPALPFILTANLLTPHPEGSSGHDQEGKTNLSCRA